MGLVYNRQQLVIGSPDVTLSLSTNGAIDYSLSTSEIDSKDRKTSWIQLAGHPGSFMPATAHTVLKKQANRETNEAKVYKALIGDSVQNVIPKFYREVEQNNEVFVEMEDLLHHFDSPNIMDIKMGTRTFLESEVKNPALRCDLYEKMVKIDPSAPTAEEQAKGAITKLRYMQFRENGSTSTSLGFRIDAIRVFGESANSDLTVLSSRQEVMETLLRFTQARPAVCRSLLQRLQEIRDRFQASKFFKHHEIIGSSLLLICDNNDDRTGVWMIDFAKTQSISRRSVTHRKSWKPGNHEDGYLTGLDNLVQIFDDIVRQLQQQQREDGSVAVHSNGPSTVNHPDLVVVDLPSSLADR